MISIFAHGHLWRSRQPDRHLAPFSSVIRGRQIVDRLGDAARLNPEADYAADTCIYVKQCPPAEAAFERPPYLDIIDGAGLLRELRRDERLRVLACSQLDRQALGGWLGEERVTFLPQHHCNFERARRDRAGLTTVGIIGTWWAWQHLPADLPQVLSQLGLRLWTYSAFTSREDVCAFYRQIDVQLVWRPYPKALSNPLKLVNAASFGVPTVAWAEPAFSEMEDAYWPAEDFSQLMQAVTLLVRNPRCYEDLARRGLERAEAYHVDRIAERYRELDHG